MIIYTRIYKGFNRNSNRKTTECDRQQNYRTTRVLSPSNILLPYLSHYAFVPTWKSLGARFKNIFNDILFFEYVNSILSAFVKLRKTTISFVMSVCTSAWNNSAPSGQNFMNLRIFPKYVQLTELSFQSDKNNGYFTGIPVCIFEYAVAQLVEALRYKPEGRGVRFPMVSLEFFIDIILPAAL